MKTEKILEEVLRGMPFEGIDDLRVIEEGTFESGKSEEGKSPMDDPRLDARLEIAFGKIRIRALAEIRPVVSPKILREIVPWLVKLKKGDTKSLYPIICPYLSQESQRYCIEYGVDFIDLSGNISLSIPGKVFIRRLDRPNRFPTQKLIQNPFSRVSSRVVRVLLEYPGKKWTVTGIGKMLEIESDRQGETFDFSVSQSTISKTILALDGEILIRRDNKKIIIPDPKRLLFTWAEKFEEQYRREARKGVRRRNPFSPDLKPSVEKLRVRYPDVSFLITGSAAANLVAPFVSIDRIDVICPSETAVNTLSKPDEDDDIGPDFFLMVPVDIGAFLFSREVEGISIVSNIQMYLDNYSRGGRDAKQASHLLDTVIEEQWKQTS